MNMCDGYGWCTEGLLTEMEMNDDDDGCGGGGGGGDGGYDTMAIEVNGE